MTYFPMGTIDASNFKTISGGICKPTNQSTLDAFRALQQQINRVLYAKKIPLIAEDGDIGPGTAKAMALALGTSTMSCSEIAGLADTYTASLSVLASSLGAPTTVSAPQPAAPPSYVNAATGALVIGVPGTGASLLDSVKNLGTVPLIVLGAAVIGVGMYLTKPTKSSKPSIRYRQRTKYITRRSRR